MTPGYHPKEGSRLSKCPVLIRNGVIRNTYRRGWLFFIVSSFFPFHLSQGYIFTVSFFAARLSDFFSFFLGSRFLTFLWIRSLPRNSWDFLTFR